MGCSSSADNSNHSSSLLASLLKRNSSLHETLEKLSEEELKELCASQTLITLKPGEILVTEGDLDDSIYFVGQGSLSFTNGVRIKGIFKYGDCTDGAAFINGSPQPATVFAIVKSTVHKLSRASYDNILFDVKKHFDRIELLKGLTPSTREAMYPFSKVVTFAKGENIVMKGEAGNQFYIVLKGEVVAKDDLYLEGNYFGEDALFFEGGLYSATATVRLPATLLAISAEGFSSPHFAAIRGHLKSCPRYSSYKILRTPASINSKQSFSLAGTRETSRSFLAVPPQNEESLLTEKNSVALKLLVVDGIASSRLKARQLLEQRLGHTVVEASDGTTALILAQKAIDNQEPFDAIFIDSAIAMRRQAVKLKLMHMWSNESNIETSPTGPTILQRLKTMGIACRVIVVQGASVGKHAALGASAVLQKPIDETAVLTMLADIERAKLNPRGTSSIVTTASLQELLPANLFTSSRGLFVGADDVTEVMGSMISSISNGANDMAGFWSTACRHTVDTVDETLHNRSTGECEPFYEDGENNSLSLDFADDINGEF